MVAYSFRPQFAEAISALRKRQTVRGDRVRHARPGERVQLYTGMRTRRCRKLVEPDPICIGIDLIEIEVDPGAPELIARIAIEGRRLTDDQVEEFSRADGFTADLLGRSARLDMGRFWLERHRPYERPAPFRFLGFLIRWEPQL